MTAERWKRQEREVAKALNGVRLPNTGAGQCDVRAPGNWALQVKTRAELPGWLWAAVDQAERDAGPHESPAVVLSEVTAGRKARRLVVLDFDRFVALVAGGGAAQTGTATDTSRAPPATPAATMAAQQTRTATRTLGVVHPSGDRPE